MNWAEIFAEVASALKALWDNVGDPTRWKMSVNGTPVGTVTSVSIDASGMTVAFNDGQGNHTLKAVPGLQEASVELDGTTVPGARLVFRVVEQPLDGKPVIGVFDYRNLTVNGVATDYRFDYPK